jgi:hypothetical protein
MQQTILPRNPGLEGHLGHKCWTPMSFAIVLPCFCCLGAQQHPLTLLYFFPGAHVSAMTKFVALAFVVVFVVVVVFLLVLVVRVVVLRVDKGALITGVNLNVTIANPFLGTFTVNSFLVTKSKPVFDVINLTVHFPKGNVELIWPLGPMVSCTCLPLESVATAFHLGSLVPFSIITFTCKRPVLKVSHLQIKKRTTAGGSTRKSALAAPLGGTTTGTPCEDLKRLPAG